MKNPDLCGALLVIFGIVILASYGLYQFAISEEIPLIIRAAVGAIIAGVAIILIYLLNERIRDIRRGE